MDPRRGMNERVSCHLASRGCPASALMHGSGYGVLSLCCDTQPHTCNTLPRLSVRKFWFAMHRDSNKKQKRRQNGEAPDGGAMQRGPLYLQHLPACICAG